MYADLSRVTFRAGRNYSAVLAQQGRVQLDADLNEQAAIHAGQLRALAADLIGPYGGGPKGGTGFEITHSAGTGGPDDLTIGGGRYYAGGIAVDATRPVPAVPVPDDGPPQDPPEPPAWTYWTQPDAFRDPDRPGDRLPADFPYLVYLRVWERSVAAVEDPALREVALGPAMPDTAARVKVVWQVVALPEGQLELGENPGADEIRSEFLEWATSRPDLPKMAARARRPQDAGDDPCLVAPDARYRGPENQLYRVEIHEGGPGGRATLKWSRENGSVVFTVDAIDGTWVELANLGGDDKLDLTAGDWVELVDTAYASRLEPLPLLRVEEVDLPARRARLSAEPDPGVGRRPELHPYLRRWDHAGGGPHARGGAMRLAEGEWLPLEDGVEVYFPAGDFDYETGDHWLVPARTATGDVEWPTDAAHRPLLADPSGIVTYYAPLAWITGPGAQVDLRLSFPPLATPVPAT
jgi:Family of unknown function (DUF6519)